MMSRSEFAFIRSAELFFEQNEHVYFWTFTVRKVYPDWYYSSIWKGFIRDVQNLYRGSLGGLRVVELHESHGIHWHALLNRRVWVGEVRRIGRRYGIGRIHVQKADNGSIDYLAKYVGKWARDTNPLFAKVSRWHTVGTFKGVRARDVEIDSIFHRAVKHAQLSLGQKQLPFELIQAIRILNTDDPKDLWPRLARYKAKRSIYYFFDHDALPLRKKDVSRHLAALKHAGVISRKNPTKINTLFSEPHDN